MAENQYGRTFAANKMLTEGAKSENMEEFDDGPKSQFGAKSKLNPTEVRPAAVLHYCRFLSALHAKCKSDLIKMGCGRHIAVREPSLPNALVPKRPHKQDREPWDKRMLRLKVYQRAFSAIVMHFKAYCPILFHIKKTYEDMLSYRINQIKLAHFEKKRLQIQKNSMIQQINTYQFPEFTQLQKSQKYLNILRQRIALQEEAIKVITGILKKMEEALSDHFERHRDLEEQIVMVDTEIANRRQKAFSMREKEEKDMKEKEAAASNDKSQLQTVDTDEEDADDPYFNVPPEEIDEERKMVWIMAFAICHKDLEELDRKLTLYQTKYQYVVPRHEHENMKRSIIEEKETSKALADEKSSLEDELSNLKVTEVKLGDELGEVKTQLTDLRKLVTPRPSWEQLGEFIQGGVPKWEKMIQGKSTKDVTEKLFGELRTRRDGENYINPLGVESTVLRCLRYGKKIPDRQLHSRDAALVIHDIWTQRQNLLSDNQNSVKKEQSEMDFGKGEAEVNWANKSFPEFVALYFESMYGDIEQRMEWTYNLVECCKRFSLDYRLTLFLGALQGKYDEGVYTLTRNELLRIRNTFLERSVEEGAHNNGTLSSNQYVDVLESTFPNKKEAEIQSIVRVTNKLNAELNPAEDADLSTYNVTQLIDVRDDGFRGALVAEIVKQFEESRQAFIDKVIEELCLMIDVSSASANKEGDPVGEKDISVVQVYSALHKADSTMDDTVAGAALAWIFTGTSVVPGCGITASRLVNYAKVQRNNSKSGDDPKPASDDDQFERAIQDIIRDDDEPREGEVQMSDAQKKTFYRAHKHAKLRTVVTHLRGSSILPRSQLYNPGSSVLPEGPINLKTDMTALRETLGQRVYDTAPVNQGLKLSMDLEEDEQNQDGAQASVDVTP